MPKKTTILVLLLAVVTVILVFLAVTQTQRQSSINNAGGTPAKKTVEKTAKVFFSPQSLDISGATSAPAAVDILVDTGSSDITGVQAELQYDPRVLTVVRLIPATDAAGFFGATAVILFNDINPQTGRISYAVTINAGQPTRKGVGKIATLTFQKAFGAPASTTINFLDKTLVTKLGAEESVLKETVPLNIVLGQAKPSVFTPSVIPSVPVTTATPVQ